MTADNETATAGAEILGATDLLTVIGFVAGASGVSLTGEGGTIIAAGIGRGIDEVDTPAPVPTPRGDVHSEE